jgi:hypothetical protein
MLKPSLRFLIVPLGAVSMIASMASQNTPQAQLRDGATRQVREQVVDCGKQVRSAAGICVADSTSAR